MERRSWGPEPNTSSILAGLTVPMPILLLEASMYKVAESMFKEFGKESVEALKVNVSAPSSPRTVFPVTLKAERVVVPPVILAPPWAVRVPVMVMLPFVSRVTCATSLLFSTLMLPLVSRFPEVATVRLFRAEVPMLRLEVSFTGELKKDSAFTVSLEAELFVSPMVAERPTPRFCAPAMVAPIEVALTLPATWTPLEPMYTGAFWAKLCGGEDWIFWVIAFNESMSPLQVRMPWTWDFKSASSALLSTWVS